MTLFPSLVEFAPCGARRPGLSHPLDVAFATPHRLAANCQPTANGSRSGGVALLRQSRSALRRSSLGHGHGQAIGARMHGSAPWKTEETIVGLPDLLVLSVFSRFGGCHLTFPPPWWLSPFHLPLISMPGEDCWPRKIPSVSDVPLNETAPRWENTNYSPSLRRTCFTLASRHQSLAQTAPLRRAINLRIKANPVPPPGFVQEACTRKAATACGEAIVCVRRPFGYRLLPFPGGPA